MFIAAAVGGGLDRDGKNKESITSYKALNEGKRNQVLRLKKAAVKVMQANHAQLPVLRLEGTCDETRTYVEHGTNEFFFFYFLLPFFPSFLFLFFFFMMIKTSYSIPTNYEGHFVSERIELLLLWCLCYRLCVAACCCYC